VSVYTTPELTTIEDRLRSEKPGSSILRLDTDQGTLRTDHKKATYSTLPVTCVLTFFQGLCSPISSNLPSSTKTSTSSSRR
jgi:hypothetical protein